MNRLLSLLLALALAIPSGGAGSTVREQDGYLVSLAEPVAPVWAAVSGCEAVDGSIYYADSLAEVEALSLFGEVECWAENDVLVTQDCFEGYETEQWNLRSVGASAGWNHKGESGVRDRLGDGVTIAVVDSGVMADHPDLADARILDTVALSSETDGLDDYHGTFVTGLLAAAVNNGLGVDGMVPNVNILPICITSNGGKTDVRTAVEGIGKAVELGADVITFSIGGTKDNEILHKACQDAADAGVILVTCAGNYTSGTSRSETRYMYPAAYDCVVTVSGCRETEDGPAFDSAYSYFNDAVTVSAPGTGITSLYLDGLTATRSGTSFAAPVAAAMAAMAKQADRSIDVEGFIGLLKESALDLGSPGFDPYYGYGYVSVPAFLKALDERIAGDPHRECPGSCFTDMPPVTGFAHLPIDWALQSRITRGLTETAFGPSAVCTRAQIVTFLWRAAGCPEPGRTATAFKDLKPGAYYEKAVAWAEEQGIAKGMTGTAFAPDAACSRAEIVTFLYRAGGSPEVTGKDSPFPDVAEGSYYADAVTWAVENGITRGRTAGGFSPGAPCTRGEAVTFLYRAAGPGRSSGT